MTFHDAANTASKMAGVRTERNRFAALAFCWADVLLELSAEEAVTFATGPTKLLLGRQPDDLIGASLSDLIADRDRTLIGGLLGIARNNGRIENATVRFQGPNGSVTSVVLCGHFLKDLGGHYFLAMRKVSQGSRNSETQALSGGLHDADAFSDILHQTFEGPGATDEQQKMTLIEISEYDSLRRRLDDEGQQDFLNTVGAYLQAGSVNGDSAARFADDRYGILHAASMDVAGLEERIAEAAQQIDPSGKGLRVSSATVEADPGQSSAEDLANGLVYAINRFRNAKGKDFNIGHLSSQMGSLVSEAAESVKSFNKIIAASDFDAVFQPIINVNNGKIHHYEALVRFRGERAKVSPYETILFAEDTGLIVDFDLAMMRKVVGWLAKTPRNSETSVAVNVSGQSVGSQKYIDEMRAFLRDRPWARGRLLFEITESARMDDLALAQDFIQGLRREGYEVCLDDFGAGAANFEYLSALEVDVIKFDGPVIRNARNAPKGRAFLKALVALCRDLRVETIGEQIDDEEGLKFLRDCGVPYVQGFLFGKPSPRIADFVKIPAMRVFQRMNLR